MRNIKRLIMPVVALALASTLLAGCASNPDSSSASGGVLRVGTTFGCDSTNPFVSISTTCLLVFRYNYPFLLQYNESGKVVSDFATKWTKSDDNLTYTFDLHKGAKWSDGKALTADDVAFTINTIVKYAKGPTASLSTPVTNVESATADSPTTLVVKYAKPTANVEGRLALLPILPQHVWEKDATGDGTALKQVANKAPLVAGGPFQLTKYTKDEIAQLKANPNYYGTKPKLAGFGLQFFSSPDAMVNALKTNQIDYAAPLPVTATASVKKAGIDVTERPGFRYHNIIINQSPNQAAHPELRDAAVREAFELAVDRKKIIDVAYLGHGTIGGSIVPPSDSEWYDPAVKPLAFDPTKAAKLLDDAGYKPGADGIRVANGVPMSYDVVLPQNAEGGEGERALQIVSEDFKKIGVELKPKLSDSATTWTQITGTDNTYDKFTLAQWGWIPKWDPDFILNAMTCAQWGSWTDNGYCNKDYDALYEKQASETDPAKRKAIVNQMQEMFYEARPYIVTHYDNLVEAHGKDWSGFGSSPLGLLDTNSTASLTSASRK